MPAPAALADPLGIWSHGQPVAAAGPPRRPDPGPQRAVAAIQCGAQTKSLPAMRPPASLRSAVRQQAKDVASGEPAWEASRSTSRPANVEELVQQIEQLEHWQRAILEKLEPHRTWCTECHAASHVWLTSTGFYCLACWRVFWDEHYAAA